MSLLLSAQLIRACIGFFTSFIFALFLREAEPFLKPSTNLIAVLAAHQIAITFFGAIVIENDSLSSLGVSDLGLGCILLLVNVATLLTAGCWCIQRHSEEQTKRLWRHAVNDRELALLEDIMGVQNRKEENTTEASVEWKVGGLGNNDMEIEGMNGHHEDIPNFQTLGVGLDDASLVASGQAVLKQFQIDPLEIVLKKKVGVGSFGEVFSGTAYGEPVAIKTMITVNKSSVSSFKAEILLTATLRSPFIVNFVGCCWSRELTCLVIEVGILIDERIHIAQT